MNLLFVYAAVAHWPSGRIVGGYEVAPAFKYDWMVSLHFYGEHLCGGTLYNKRTVITAAHCDEGPIKAWEAFTHRHDLDEEVSEEGGHASKIFRRISHPQYNYEFASENDISIWQVRFPEVSPILLDTGEYTKQDTLLTVIGWGDTSSNGLPSRKLLEVKLPVYNQALCKEAYEELYDSQLCVGYREGDRDACQGDSGGPIFTKSDRGYVLVGVVSNGKGCGLTGFPGIYTSVARTSDFILQNVI